MGFAMSTSTPISLSSSFTPVAQGPGNVSFQPIDYDADWAILETIDGTTATTSNRTFKGRLEPMALATGEYLHLRGRGVCAITAETPYP